VLFGFVTKVNAELDAKGRVSTSDRDLALGALRSMDTVLGLLEVAQASRVIDDDLSSWVERMIEERAQARASKDFARADEIREELSAKNIVLEDSAEGTRWKVVN
ncbi:MAG TPA: cysteine--tRNA ligase, partial [Gemmatimonadetes bacterium]|nr:cysteine--tRNA ligase [Gemmatimonadota bacterium]